MGIVDVTRPLHSEPDWDDSANCVDSRIRHAIVAPRMKWQDYAFLGVSLLCVFCLGYSWVWWIKTGRHQPGKRTGRAVTALVYNTMLPFLLMGSLPHCFVPSYALIGLLFATIGFVLALLGQGKLRHLLAICALVWFLIFAASIPTSPFPSRSGPNQTGIQRPGC